MSAPFPARLARVARRVLLFALAVVVSGTVQAGSDPGQPQGWEEVRARGKADIAAAVLVSELRGELDEPPESTAEARLLNVCGGLARRLTEEASHGQFISVRCTALSARRSNHRPDEYERAWLTEAGRAADAGVPPAAVYEVFRDQYCELRHVRWLVVPTNGSARVAISVRVGIHEPCSGP